MKLPFHSIGRRASRKWLLALALPLLFLSGCDQQKSVTAYVALDRVFSEPILQDFEAETGIRVDAVYDVEASKTIGLTNRILTERDRPQCDVFWNNEILQTLRLEQDGALQPYESPGAKDIPERFRDPAGMWTGFAARARVIIYNTDAMEAAEVPQSIRDWADEKYAGRFAVANPHFGTTSTHLAVMTSLWGVNDTQAMLQSWLDNDVAILAGNATVRDDVAAGRFDFGLTDTDDAFGGIDAGRPVAIVYPKEGLLIPNTLSLIADAPHPEEGRRLIDYLLRPEIEERLAHGLSGQIPVRDEVSRPERVPALDEVHSLPVEWPKVMDAFLDSVELADWFVEE